tara:strand:- start:44485 stop:44625 length:141 start_codon:yes stop_codon:yes gene_type:complete
MYTTLVVNIPIASENRFSFLVFLLTDTSFMILILNPLQAAKEQSLL